MTKLSATVIFAITMVGLFVASACSVGSPFNDTMLAQRFGITNEWKRLEVGDKLTIKGDNQFLSVRFDEPFHAAYGEDGIRSGGGQLFNVEVQLIDENGNPYPLQYTGKLGNQRVNYRHAQNLPANLKYTAILLRSDVPIEVKEIIWTYYFDRDIH